MDPWKMTQQGLGFQFSLKALVCGVIDSTHLQLTFTPSVTTAREKTRGHGHFLIGGNDAHTIHVWYISLHLAFFNGKIWLM